MNLWTSMLWVPALDVPSGGFFFLSVVSEGIFSTRYCDTRE
jgi:hypothetical protein